MSILVATDFSDNAEAALAAAARLAHAHAEELVVLHCQETAVDETPWRHALSSPGEIRGQLWKAAQERLEETFESVVPPEGRPTNVDLRVDLEYAAGGILGVLNEQPFSLAVLGATGLSRLANFFLGSTTEEVVRRSDTPVLVVPADTPARPYRRIVAPVDFTDCSRKSLERAADLAREDGAELVIIHSYTLPVSETTFLPTQLPPETIEAYQQQQRDRLDEFVESIDLGGLETTVSLEVGAPHNAIVETVEDQEADLVVMGTHGRRGFDRLFLGSTATRILRRMPTSIMTVRTSEAESPEADGDEPS
jgi:nucleotide-binding universal stress UspA family protein